MLGCVTSSPLQGRGITQSTGNSFLTFPVDVAVRVPESGDDDPGLGVDEDNFVFGKVEAEQVDLGTVSDGVNLVARADHPVIVSELQMLGVGRPRPWRAGDDASVVHDEHRHSMDDPIVFKFEIILIHIKQLDK